MKGISQFVLWWLPKGELPTLQVAKDKLELHEKQGDSPSAFTMNVFYDHHGELLKI